MNVSIDKILAATREAPTAGYSERLDLMEKAAQSARAFCRTLKKIDALQSRPVLRAILEMPLFGKCAPECCSASYVHAVEIEAKCEVLTTWSRLDPEVAIELPPALVAQLIVPTSRRIALAAIELLGRSDAGRRFHAASLVAAMAHPRWQVVELAARALGRLGKDAPWKTTDALTEAMRHKQWQVRRVAAKALGDITAGKHAALNHAAKKDRHKAVRYVACKVTGKEFVWP